MTVVYLLNAGVSAGKEGGRLVVKKDGEQLYSVPLQAIQSVVIGRNARLTTPAMFTLMKSGTPLVYVDGFGRILGTLMDDHESLKRLKRQLAFSEDPKKSMVFACEILSEKLAAQIQLLRYFGRSRQDAELQDVADRIASQRGELLMAESIDALRGIEGIAAARYFGIFSRLLVGDYWKFTGRAQHPAHDPVNALLNYGYAFLEREVRVALSAVLLDPRIGILHVSNGRKDSLVFDIMEPFRQKVIDRLVLKLLNRRVITQEDFSHTEEGCRLTRAGRCAWIGAYEKYMETVVKEYGGLTPRAWLRKKVYDWEGRMREIDGTYPLENVSN